jgi:cytochrome c oxidase subunit 2
VVTFLLIIFSTGVGYSAKEPTTRHITLYAKQWEFTPNIIEVNQGDTVVINLISLDVSHGIYFEGYEIKGYAIMFENKPSNVTITFKADKPGTYIFRCAITCGPFHPFMTGKLVVQPVTPLYSWMIISLILTIASLALFYIWRW